MEHRKVQRVGYSTLTVSLPREWVQDVKLKPSDTILIKREDDGSLRLIPGTQPDRDEVKSCVINADLCNAPNLLTRLITGNYILGHDTIQVTAREELKRSHLEEIRSTIQRLTGLSIVEQSFKTVTLQSFVDPTRFSIYGLVRRLQVIITSMLDTAAKALIEGRPELVGEVSHMEDECDRIYWLITRQLLLAVRDRTVGVKMGIESPVHIAGNRLIAKTLEEMADCADNMAQEVFAIKDKKIVNPSILADIAKFESQVAKILEESINALLTVDVVRSNRLIETIQSAENDEKKLTSKILGEKDPAVAASLRTILWNLTQIGRYCKIIAEVSLNRFLEKPSEVCDYVAVALHA